MSLPQLKKILRKADSTFSSDRITIADVSRRGGALADKIENAMDIEVRLERIKRCKTAGQVFTEFAADAAAAKVAEAFDGRTSEARQRAQETILEYALGKPINRTLSFSGRIAESSDEELEHDIKRLLIELGFSSGEGATSRLFMGVKGPTQQIQTIEVQAQPRISTELREVSQENPSVLHGEPGRQDND